MKYTLTLLPEKEHCETAAEPVAASVPRIVKKRALRQIKLIVLRCCQNGEGVAQRYSLNMSV